jgi:hypothetical protein
LRPSHKFDLASFGQDLRILGAESGRLRQATGLGHAKHRSDGPMAGRHLFGHFRCRIQGDDDVATIVLAPV